jgi:hypothetical protein
MSSPEEELCIPRNQKVIVGFGKTQIRTYDEYYGGPNTPGQPLYEPITV